jgi:hypothetical protein
MRFAHQSRKKGANILMVKRMLKTRQVETERLKFNGEWLQSMPMERNLELSG